MPRMRTSDVSVVNHDRRYNLVTTLSLEHHRLQIQSDKQIPCRLFALSVAGDYNHPGTGNPFSRKNSGLNSFD